MIYSDLPYDEAGGHGGTRPMTQMIVIHATANTASDEAEARYAEGRDDGVSAHFYCDGDSIIQALDTSLVAYGCYPIGNSRSVQFELTGYNWDRLPPVAGAVSDATMRWAAGVVARVARDYGIPVRKLSPADLRAGASGICGHGDVTLAWGEGDHTDPGAAFPWPTFLSYVLAASDPTVTAAEETDVPEHREQLRTGRYVKTIVDYRFGPADGAPWLSISTDTLSEPGMPEQTRAAWRIAYHVADGALAKVPVGWHLVSVDTDSQDIRRRDVGFPPGVDRVSVQRVPVDVDDLCEVPAAVRCWQ